MVEEPGSGIIGDAVSVPLTGGPQAACSHNFLPRRGRKRKRFVFSSYQRPPATRLHRCAESVRGTLGRAKAARERSCGSRRRIRAPRCGSRRSRSGVIEFRRARTTVPPFGGTARLVDTGIYRWTRNPMYLGMALAYAGAALLLNSLWCLVLLPLALTTAGATVWLLA
jgi:hypothetical protein